MRLTVLDDNRSSMVCPDVEQHICRTITTVVVAVDTMIRISLEFAVVLVDGMDIPIGKVTLVNTQLAIQLIARLD